MRLTRFKLRGAPFLALATLLAAMFLMVACSGQTGDDGFGQQDGIGTTEEPGMTEEPNGTEDGDSGLGGGEEGTDQPGMTEEPGATDEPGMTEEPGATDEPGMTEEPGATDEPGMTEEPGATDEPGMTEEPGATDEPGMTEEPGATEEQVQVTEDPDLGAILADSDGMTLYLLESDAQGESTCYESCAAVWPPFSAAGEVSAGEGIDESLIDTIERDDGQTQVTYNGWPLYYYTSDMASGDVTGHEVEDEWGLWLAVTPEGGPVEASGTPEETSEPEQTPQQ